MKIFQRVLAASQMATIPFVTEEMLTAQAGYLVSEEGVSNIEAALEAADTSAAIQTQLDASNQALAASKLELATAQTELATAKTELFTAKESIAAAQTDAANAQADAATWKAKAIEFGAKPAEAKTVEVPTTEAQASDDDTEKVLASLPHNRKADRILG